MLKNPFVQKTYKQLLHKKGKQWIVVGLSALTLMGLGSIFNVSANADTDTKNVKNNINSDLKAVHVQTQPVQNQNNVQTHPESNATNITNINNQASNLHKQIVGNNEKASVHNSNVNQFQQKQNVNNKPTISNANSAQGHINRQQNNQVEQYNLTNIDNPNKKNIKNRNKSTALVKGIKIGDIQNKSNDSKFYSGNVTTGIYQGLNYKAYSNGGVEFTDGTMTWNESDESPSFLSNASSNMQNAKSIKFDSGIDTSNVTDMRDMFESDKSLQSLDLGDSFDTSNVTNMSNMFSNENNLQSLNLGNKFDTSNVTSMSFMFSDNDSLNTLIVDSPKTKINSSALLPTMYQEIGQNDEKGKPYTLDNANDFNNGKVGTFITTKNPKPVIQYSDIYGNIDSKTTPTSLSSNQTTPQGWTFVDKNGNKVNTPQKDGKGNIMIAPEDDGLVYKCNKSNGNLEFTNGTANTDLSDFYKNSDVRNYKTINFDSDINVSNVLDMSDMFSNSSVQTLNLGNNFNTSGTYSMNGMFYNDPNLQTLKLGNSFNTSKVNNMNGMFYDDYKLQSLNLPSSFNTSNVNTMSDMFMSDNNLQLLNLGSNFNTSNVTDMNFMFNSDKSLPSLDLGKNFDTSKVTNMSYMFNNDSCLNTLIVDSPKTKINSTANLPTMYQKITPEQDDNNGRPYTLITPNDFTRGITGIFITRENPIITTNKIAFKYNNTIISFGTISGKVGKYISYNDSRIKAQIPNNYYIANSDFIIKKSTKNNKRLIKIPKQFQLNSINNASNIYHDIGINLIPQNNIINMSGTIYLHFENTKNKDINVIPIHYNKQVSESDNSNINILPNGNYPFNMTSITSPSDFLNKTLNIDGKPFNTDNFIVDSNKGNNNDYNKITIPNDYFSNSNVSNQIYNKDLNLYFIATNQTKENIQYINSDNKDLNNSFTISGSDESMTTTNSIASNIPTGYSLANPNSMITINGDTAYIPLVQQKIADKVNFNNKSKGVTKSGYYKSNIENSDIKDIPYGYHLASNAISPNTNYGGNSNNTINVNLTPNTEHEVINYYYHNNSGQNILAGTSYATGVFGNVANINKSNESGLDNGYGLINNNNSYTYGNMGVSSSNGDNYGNGYIDVAVKPKYESTTIQFQNNSNNNSSSNTLSSFTAINPNPNYPNNNVPISDIIKHLPDGYKLQNTNINIPYSKKSITNIKVVPKFNINSQLVTGKAYITLNYYIKGTNKMISKVDSVELNGHLNDSPQYISPWNPNFLKTGYTPDNPNPIKISFNKDIVDANDNGDYTRYNRYLTFNYTATPIAIIVQYIDTNNGNNIVKYNDNLGKIGLTGQIINLQNNPSSDARLTINGNPYTLNVPAGYHLKNQSNYILVSPNSSINERNTNLNEELGQPLMLLKVPINTYSTKPNIPNKSNIPNSSTPNNNSINNNTLNIAYNSNKDNVPIVPNNILINSSHFNNNNTTSNSSDSNSLININTNSNKNQKAWKDSFNNVNNNLQSPTTFTSNNLSNITSHHRSYNIKQIYSIKSLVDVKPNQVVNYDGIKIINVTNKHTPYYIYNIKNILLHRNIHDIGNIYKYQTKINKKYGFTGKILLELKINNKLRFLIYWHHHIYLTTANPDYVRNAYIQPKEFKYHIKGTIKHTIIKLRKNAKAYNCVHFNSAHFKKNIKAGSKVTVVGLKHFGQKGYKRTRLVLSNGLIITANKNYVEFI